MTGLTKALPEIDAETVVTDADLDHKRELRAWLRLFTCTTLIENSIRSRLREQFSFTLPRFDLLAQLDRSEDGLVLGEVSKRLMVSAGNITPITEKLIENGYITRRPSEVDRRIQIISMTQAGRAAFRVMAEEHGKWIADLFSDLSEDELDVLMGALAKLKGSVKSKLDVEA